jgi:hypothetical protein
MMGSGEESEVGQEFVGEEGGVGAGSVFVPELLMVDPPEELLERGEEETQPIHNPIPNRQKRSFREKRRIIAPSIAPPIFLKILFNIEVEIK